MNDALTSVPEVPENPEKYELNIDLPDLKDLIVTSVSAGLNALRVINIPNVNVDSIMEIVNAEIEDSLGHYDKKEFKVKMEKLRRKLEKLKEEKNNN